MAKDVEGSGGVCFPDMDASPEGKALGIQIIDNYLGKGVMSDPDRPAFPKKGLKKKVIQIQDND